jgi:hypothetical protein
MRALPIVLGFLGLAAPVADPRDAPASGPRSWTSGAPSEILAAADASAFLAASG